jgi:Na+-translocating ferredoxin:NAD+ oxidoreductase RnfG subunit
MKQFFQTKKLLLIFVAVLIALFALGGVYSNYMTDRIIYHELSELFPEATAFHAFVPETIADEESFVRAYHVFDKQTPIGVVYVVAAQGKMGKLEIAYGVNLDSDKVTGVKVLTQNETPAYYSRLSSAFYQQFQNYSFDQLNMTISTVAGATLSSTAFQLGLVAARLQYAADYDFEIPNAVVLIHSLTRNLDLATLVAKPFFANITDLVTGETMDVSLSATYDFVAVETNGATQPSSGVLAELKTTAARDYASLKQTFASAYDAGSRTLTISTKGYGTSGILVTLVLNPTLDGVESYLLNSQESYGESGEVDEAYLPTPGVEAHLLDDYMADQAFAAVAGATYTSQGMQRLFDFLNQIFSENGGN